MIEKLAQATDIRAALVVGGLSMQVQASTLKTSPEIVVATPVSPLLLIVFWSSLLGSFVFISPVHSKEVHQHVRLCWLQQWVP